MTGPIDMRCRPAYLHDFFGATPGTQAYDTTRWLNRRVGTRGPDDHFDRSRTHEGFLAEVRDAGLSKAIVVGRHTPTQHLPNERIAEIVRNEPLLGGIGSVDPDLLGKHTLESIEHAIHHLGLLGINIEPGFADQPKHPDDPVYFPVYELCQALKVPVFLMSGPTTPDLRFNDPAPIAKVAQAFPALDLVCYHGYYPNVLPLIGVAFRYERVHVVPDMYLYQPGSEAFIQAANGFMSEQLMFGSSYPFRPILQSIEDLLTMGLRDDVVNKVLRGNAQRVLKLN